MPEIHIFDRFFLGFFILCIIVVYIDGRRFNTRNPRRNLISVKFTNESVRELRIAFRGFLMMETSGFQNSDFELHLKQITDGKRLIQTVYQDGILKDCDLEENLQFILQFVEKFASIYEKNPRKSNEGNVFEMYEKTDGSTGAEAFKYFKRRRSLGKFKNLIKMKHDIKACHRLTRHIRREHLNQRAASIKHKTVSLTHILNMLRKKFRKELQDAKDNTSLTGTPKQETPKGLQHSQIHVQAGQKVHDTSLRKDLHVEAKAEKNIQSRTHKRSKRSSLFNRFLMYPGTKWCGRGQTALHYNDLGTDIEADVCCRDHDLCPHIIESFTYNFGIFNYRIHALLHCKCDKRFRECLQQSVSPTASFLGEIYFNIMGTKCFEFEYEKICTSRSWWGSCLKYEKKQIAHVKAQTAFGYF